MDDRSILEKLLCEKFLYCCLFFIIFPFSKMGITNIPCFIYEIECWPVSIVVFPPSFKIIILNHWEGQSILLHSILYIFYFSFIGKLWTMNPYNSESLVFVFFIQCLCFVKRIDTINTTKRPKLHSNDLSPEVF